MTLLSFVIPCYRSELTIEAVISEIIDTVSLKQSEFDYEIVAVNDCSPDGVYDVLKRLASHNTKIKVVNLSKNMGKHAAVMAGYSIAKGDLIVNLDDDFQCPIYDLWKMMEPIEEGYDVAMAKYPVKKQSAFKNFGSRINAKMAEIMLDKPKNMHYENFSIMKRYVCDEMIRYKNPYPYLEGLILRTTRRIANVEVEERNRLDNKKTGFTFIKSFSLLMNGFTAFSVKPLRIATFTGCIISALGFIFGIVTIIRKIMNLNYVMGYSSMMAVQLFIGGIIILLLGLLGEYIGRIYICLNASPQYVIRDTINCDLKDLQR